MFTCHEQLFALSFFNWGESVKPNPWLKSYKKKKAILLCDLYEVPGLPEPRRPSTGDLHHLQQRQAEGQSVEMKDQVQQGQILG